MMQYEQMNFCYNIKFLRKKHSFDCLKMSELLKITLDELKSIENGSVPDTVSCDVVFKILDYFKVTPQMLFDRRLD